MQKLFVRSAGLAIWLAAASVTIWLTLTLSGGDAVITALSMLAIAAGSFSLVFARHAWQKGARPEAAVAGAVWIVAAFCLLALELSYFSGSVESAHKREVARAQSREAQQMILAKATSVYAATATRRAPEELDVLMRAELAKQHGGKTLAARTSNCTDAAAWHYRFCDGFLKLEAERAAALEAGKLKKEIWEVGTSLEHIGVARDFSAAADFLHRNVGGSLEMWVMLVVLAPVILLFLLRDGMLFACFVGDKKQVQSFAMPEQAPERPERPAEPQKQPEAPKPQKKRPGRPRGLQALVTSFGRPRVVAGTEIIEAPALKQPRPRVTSEDRQALKMIEGWLAARFRKSTSGETLTVLAAFKDFENWSLASGFETTLSSGLFVQHLAAYDIAPRDTPKGRVIDGALKPETRKRVA